MRPLCEKIKRTTLMREQASRICGGQGGLTSGAWKVSGERSLSDKHPQGISIFARDGYNGKPLSLGASKRLPPQSSTATLSAFCVSTRILRARAPMRHSSVCTARTSLLGYKKCDASPPKGASGKVRAARNRSLDSAPILLMALSVDLCSDRAQIEFTPTTGLRLP